MEHGVQLSCVNGLVIVLLKVYSVMFTDNNVLIDLSYSWLGERCSSVVRAFAHGAMGRRINPSWGEPFELFLVPASAPRLV